MDKIENITHLTFFFLFFLLLVCFFLYFKVLEHLVIPFTKVTSEFTKDSFFFFSKIVFLFIYLSEARWKIRFQYLVSTVLVSPTDFTIWGIPERAVRLLDTVDE